MCCYVNDSSAAYININPILSRECYHHLNGFELQLSSQIPCEQELPFQSPVAGSWQTALLWSGKEHTVLASYPGPSHPDRTTSDQAKVYL